MNTHITSRIAEHRANADQMRAMAASARTPELREQFLTLANSWEVTASRAAAAEASSLPEGIGSRPRRHAGGLGSMKVEAMGDEHSLLAWVKGERFSILHDIEAFKHGLRTQQSVKGGPWIDTTEQEVGHLKVRLRRLEEYIAKHGDSEG